MRSTLFVLLIALMALSVNATIINVPANQPTIQAGIDAASNGDTVLVAPGTYVENIDYLSKNIVVTSNYLYSEDTIDIATTIIDGSEPQGSDYASVVYMGDDLDSTAQLNGFTVVNGSGAPSPYTPGSRYGGGIAVFGFTKAKITNNWVHSNDIGWAESLGGGIGVIGRNYDSPLTHPLIAGNRIYSNRCKYIGAAIYVERGYADIEDNIIFENSDNPGSAYRGAVGIHEAVVSVSGNTFVNNTNNCVAADNTSSVVYVSDNTFVLDTALAYPIYAVRKYGGGSFGAPENNCMYGAFTDYFSGVSFPGLMDTSYTNVNGDVCDAYFNLYRDPAFCDAESSDFTVWDTSVCVGAASDSGIIGAGGIGCIAYSGPVWYVDSFGSDTNEGSESSPFASIQRAIDATTHGDTVLVAPGTYVENIDFTGKNIVVASEYLIWEDTSAILNTIIDGSDPVNADSGSVVTFQSNEDSTTLLCGFSLVNGTGTMGEDCPGGGAIYCRGNSSPRIESNYIRYNHLSADWSIGAGIYVAGLAAPNVNSRPHIIANRFYNNSCAGLGSALYLQGTCAIVEENVFYNNTAQDPSQGTGVVALYKSSITLWSNTFGENADRYLTDWQASSPSSADVRDNIFYLPSVQTIDIYAFYSYIGTTGFPSFSNNCLYGEFTDYFNQLPAAGVLDTSYTNANGDVCDLYENIYRDPSVCNVSTGDYSLIDTSVCVGAGSGGGTIGALGVGCYSQPELSGIDIQDEDNMHVLGETPTFVWQLTSGHESPQDSFVIAIGTDDEWTYAEMWNPAPFESPDTFVTYAGLSLDDGATYYGRLKASDGYAWSEWYSFSFRMNTAPSIPTPHFPADEEVVGNQPTLWIQNSVDLEADPLTYDFVCVVDTLYGEPDPIHDSGIAETPDSTGWTVSVTLDENKRYTWRVRSFDGYEYSDWTLPYDATFWVDGVPEAPANFSISAPDPGSMPQTDMLPTFEWSESTDPDPLDTVRYRLEVAINPEFTFKIEYDSLTGTNYKPSDSLQFGEQYWWRVWAFDADGNEVLSANAPTFWTWTLGDVQNDHASNISDLTYLVAYLFSGGPSPVPLVTGELTGDCAINISDLTYFVAYLFAGGPPPVVGCEPPRSVCEQGTTRRE